MVTRLFLIVLTTYLAWLGMMAVHEAGHVLHALASGGRVTYVTVPLFGFSRTDISPNPHPRFVAVGGPLWGCVLPYIAATVARGVRRRPSIWLQMFAAFCCVANGAYIGAGAVAPAGDTRVLRAQGVDAWVLGATGLVALSLGLWELHRLGLSAHKIIWGDELPSPTARDETHPPNPPTSVV